MRYLLLFFLGAAAALSAQTDVPDPIDPLYRDIFNAYEEKLEGLGYPVGRAGNAAYVPGQYLLKYGGANAAAAFATDLARLRQLYGNNNVTVVGECGCSDLFRIYTVQFRNLGGEERGRGGREELASNVGQEEVEPNYYLVPELEQVQSHPAFNQLPPNFAVVPSANPNPPVTIALLDTGLDPTYQHPQLTNGQAPLYLWENPDPLAADDPFCLADDRFGWDFSNDDNAPVDDHSHGTHVASRIAHQLRQNAPAVNYRFMSVKMLDQNGVGTSFQAACAVYYAAFHGADVINASWGFYGESDRILREAFAYAEARGVATMTSAGNYRRDLSETRHYPSGYALESNPLTGIFFTSAVESGVQLWPLTNFRANPGIPGPDFLAAPGSNLPGLVPHHFGVPNNVALKSGTSIATPYASALAAHYHHLHPGASPATLRRELIGAIRSQGRPGQLNVDGRVLPFRVFEWVNLP